MHKVWRIFAQKVLGLIQERGIDPHNVVVLLPFTQLIPVAKSAYAELQSAGFSPLFATSHSWAESLPPFTSASHKHAAHNSQFAHSIHFDMALDLQVANYWLAQASPTLAEQIPVNQLTQMAYALAASASAQAPAVRVDWLYALRAYWSRLSDEPWRALESALTLLALEWAGQSAYATDNLFQQSPALCVVLRGVQADPLCQSLALQWGDQAVTLDWFDLLQEARVEHGSCDLFSAQDSEAEALQAAAACIAALDQGQSPVALIAQDRTLSRRISAMLGSRGVRVKDETGWQLSTTRAAAGLMALLRATAWDADGDAVLAWLKTAPTFSGDSQDQASYFTALSSLEQQMRAQGVRRWAQVLTWRDAETQALRQAAEALRSNWGATRSLQNWLQELKATLQADGQWAQLEADEAGQQIIQSLKLEQPDFANATLGKAQSQKITHSAFSQWLRQVLEANRYRPSLAAVSEAEVTMLPLAQLMGRGFASVVMPACDANNLNPSSGVELWWSAAERQLLGLPSIEAIASAQDRAWQSLFVNPAVHLLHRQSMDGDPLPASPKLLLLQAERSDWTFAQAASTSRKVVALHYSEPAPRLITEGEGDTIQNALAIRTLSASGYQKLRDCPYRYFATTTLALSEADELGEPPSARDWGNFLHALLREYAEDFDTEHMSVAEQRDTLNLLFQKTQANMAWSDADAMQFMVIWPRLREGFLQWSTEQLAAGWHFQSAEEKVERPHAGIVLKGSLDRIDSQIKEPSAQSQAQGGALCVIDYKTEGNNTTSMRVKNPEEDVQLAFYAALTGEQTQTALYLNLSASGKPDKDGDVQSHALKNVQIHAKRLLDGIANDVAAIHAGAALRALGEGTLCEYCDVRGLCRRDFWK